MAQASGSSAEIWIKNELVNGETPSDDAGASTTLAAAVNPGATSITVASGTGIANNEILRVGSGAKMEFVKVSDISGAPTLTLDSNTKINFRHEIGEAVVETDPTNDWFKIGNVRSFNPTGGRPLQESQAVSGARVLSNFRSGNYDAGADMTVEFDMVLMGLFILHSLNNDYSSAGTTQSSSPVNTTLDGAVAKGDTSIVVASATNVATGVFLLIGTGTDAEIVKVGTYVSGTTVDLDPAAHPFGLRKAHDTGVAVVEKIAPFTHTVVRGSALPEGLSILLRFSDIDSLMLIRGCKFANMTATLDPGDLPTVSMNVVGKAFQILSENIFGTPTTVEHIPYAHWETLIEIDDAQLTTNYFEQLSIAIGNVIQANNIVGSPFKGAITPGAGDLTVDFTYQYGSQAFAEKIVGESESKLEFIMTYIGDNNHQISLTIWKAKFGGTPHPGFSSKDPITSQASARGRLDTSTGTDITAVIKSNQPTLEFPVEDVTQ